MKISAFWQFRQRHLQNLWEFYTQKLLVTMNYTFANLLSILIISFTSPIYPVCVINSSFNVVLEIFYGFEFLLCSLTIGTHRLPHMNNFL